MKVTPIKMATAAIVLAYLSLASCKSAGYGCDYGSTDLNDLNTDNTELCAQETPQDEAINTNYRKVSKP